MEQNKVESLFLSLKDSVPQEKLAVLKNALNNAPADRYDLVNLVKLKNPTTILLMSILLGGIAVDRFMLGDIGLGILKILFGFGIWPLIDIFLCYKKAKEQNLQEILLALS